MSLYETVIITILKSLVTGELTLQDIRNKVPNDIYQEIKIYEDNHSMKPMSNLRSALIREQYKLADYFLSTSDDLDGQLRFGMSVGVKLNNMDIIHYIEDKGFKNWNYGMRTAIERNNFPLIEYFITKGANDWNSGLRVAAVANNKVLIQYFIDKGAHDWSQGLGGAIFGKHPELITYFTSLGIQDYTEPLINAIFVKNDNLINQYLIQPYNLEDVLSSNLQFHNFYMVNRILDSRDLLAPHFVVDNHPFLNTQLQLTFQPFIDKIIDVEYYEILPLLQQGMLIDSSLYSLSRLYIKNYNLLLPNNNIRMDDFLKNLFISTLPLYVPEQSIENNHILQLNIHKISTFDAIKIMNPNFDPNDCHVYWLIFAFLLHCEYPSNNPDLQPQLIREYYILDSMY